MIKIENVEVVGWEHVIRGMRNPKNSWDKSDSLFFDDSEGHACKIGERRGELDLIEIGTNDHNLMMRLAKGGPVHAKYRRMITVYLDITAPLYWWKEFDTYKVGTVANSCSTMHKIHAKEFTLEDFSYEHMHARTLKRLLDDINELNFWRDIYLNGGVVDNEDGTSCTIFGKGDKEAWYQMIQLLGSNYNQRRTIMLTYEVLANMHRWRKDHKLDDWREFCKLIESLPYSEIITGRTEA